MLFSVYRATRRHRGRAIGWLLALALWLGCGVAIAAAENRRKDYALPASDAAPALKKFAEQSDEQVVFLVNQVKGVRTNPVYGRFTAREAIERLIADTVLRVVTDQQTGAFMVQRGPDPAPPREAHVAPEEKSPQEASRPR